MDEIMKRLFTMEDDIETLSQSAKKATTIADTITNDFFDINDKDEHKKRALILFYFNRTAVLHNIVVDYARKMEQLSGKLAEEWKKAFNMATELKAQNNKADK